MATIIGAAGGQTVVSGGSLRDVVDVKDYRAKGDNTTVSPTDDTAAIQAAINATPRGGRVVFPIGRYRLTSSLTITKPLIIEGVVGSAWDGQKGVLIEVTSASTDAFVVTSDNVTFRHLAIFNQAAASAVNTGQATGIRYSSGDFGKLEDCRIVGWYRGVWWQNCAYWRMRDNYVTNAVKYLVVIQNVAAPDAGDQVMEGNVFSADMTTYSPDAAVRYQSGGGLKMIGNKVLRCGKALDIATDDGVDTSVLTVVGNSFEHQTVSAISMKAGGASGTGTFRRGTIGDNQISGDQASGPIIDLGKGISELAITGNNMWAVQSTSTLVYLTDGCSDIAIHANHFNRAALGVMIELPGASTVSNVNIGLNHFDRVTTPVYDRAGTVFSERGLIERTHYRAMPNTINTSTYTDLARIEVTQLAGCYIELHITGRLAGLASPAISQVYRRTAVRHDAGSAVTIAVNGSDTTTGAVFVVNFDLTTSPGSVRIQAKRQSADGATGMTGAYALIVRGACDRVIFLS